MVTGGRPLNGSVKIPAAKNSVLPLFAASLLCTGEVRLQAVPRLADVEHCMALLRGVGCAARWEGSDAVLSGPPANSTLPGQTAGQMRASILFCAPLLARLGRAETSLPGGCRIGARPIDLHLAGLAKMGAVELEAGEGRLVLTAPSGLHGAEITLRFPSVGGHRDASAGRCLCQRQDHPAGSGPGTGDRRPCRFSEPVRRLHRGGGQLHDPHRRAAGAFRVLFFAPARPYFCFHAGLRLCGGGRPGGTDRLRPCALCAGAGNSGTNGVPGGTGGGYGANFPLWAAARGRPGVHRGLSGPCHRCRPAAGGGNALCRQRKQHRGRDL